MAASTQNQALSALLFLYREVLGVELPWLDDILRAKRPERLPVALTRDEVRAGIERLAGAPRLMACLRHGAGLRVLECCRRRVHDVGLPATRIYVDRATGQRRRHHLHETVLQRKVRRAVWQAGIPKRASPHTLRHSFATGRHHDG